MDNDKISIGATGTPNKPPMPPMPPAGLEDEFKVPTEDVKLPSGGAFYPGGQSTVKLKYLTAEEDNILFSADLIRSNKVLEVLLDRSVIDMELRPDDMVSGDRSFLFIELRKTGFGNEYKPGTITCGNCGHDNEPTVDLNKLKPKPLEVMPDEQGWYPLQLPLTKMNIRFRLLRGSDEKRLSKIIESSQKKASAGIMRVSNLITERYLLQIMEVNGNTDKTYIKRFINAMPTRDSLFFREYCRQIEPGIDLDYEFLCPYCGETEVKQVPITTKLFYPDSE